MKNNKEYFKKLNDNIDLPLYNENNQLIVIGCNYHTTWQSKKDMRFVLVDVKGNQARLKTRNTKKDFWTNLKDLIFIQSDYNTRKSKDLRNWEQLNNKEA